MAGLVVLAVIFSPAWPPRLPGARARAYGIGKRQNVPVTMADGTVLRADIYFPTNTRPARPPPGPFPVILTQTPYGKDSARASFPGGEQLAGLSG